MVTFTGGFMETAAAVGVLTQLATAPAAGGHALPKPSPVNVSFPTGSALSTNTELCPGITDRFCTTVCVPVTVMRMQLTSLGAALNESVACPTNSSDPPVPEL